MRTKACIAIVLILGLASSVFSAPASDDANHGSASPTGTLAPCLYTGLSSGILATWTLPAGTTSGGMLYTQATHNWCALGIRAPASDNWDEGLYGSPAAEPACVNPFTERGRSFQTTGVDILVADYHGDPLLPQTDYPAAGHVTGTQSASMEWDSGNDVLFVNGIPVLRSTDSNDILECWDVVLTDGYDYSFQLQHSGAADLKLLLFRGGAQGTSVLSRVQREFETSSSTLYTAPASGTYAVVVVNDNGFNGNYNVSVSSCLDGSPRLAADTPLSVGASTTVTYVQTDFKWAAISARPAGANTAWKVDWDNTPPVYPSCVPSVGATTGYQIGTAFVAVSPDAIGLQAAQLMKAGNASAFTEWDQAGTLLPTDGTTIAGSFGASENLDVFAFSSFADHAYRVDFSADASTQPRLFAFPAETSRSVRGQESWSLGPGEHRSFIPGGGRLGLVATRDLPGTSNYSVSVTDCASYLPLPPGLIASGVTYWYDNPQSAWSVAALGADPNSNWTLTLEEGDACAPVIGGTTNGPDATQFLVRRNAPAGPHFFRGTGGNTPAFGRTGGSEALAVDFSGVSGVINGYGDVFRAYSVGLVGGFDYDIDFTHPNTGFKLLVFAPSSGWAGRSTKVLETTTRARFMAPADDQYLLLIVNDASEAGPYHLAVSPLHCGEAIGKGSIGLYSDPAGMNSCFTLPAGLTTTYVVAKLEGPTLGGIEGAEFRLEFSTTANYFYLWTPAANTWVYGNPIDTTPLIESNGEGADIVFQNCQTGPLVLLGTVSIFNVGGAGGPLEIRTMPRNPPSNPGNNQPSLVLCDAPVYTHVSLTSAAGPALGGDPVVTRTFINTPTCTNCQPSNPSDAGDPPPIASAPPQRMHLANSPDPFNPSTQLKFDVPRDGLVELRIYDVRGRRVRTLLAERRKAGAYSIDWDGKDDQSRGVRSGVYFARLVTAAGTTTDRLTLLK